MRITRATTFIVGNPWQNWLFVRLDTDQPGLYGLGEGTLNAFAKTVDGTAWFWRQTACRIQVEEQTHLRSLVRR